jgi:GDP-D-mannose 3', 5'-epimerase
MKKDLVVVAGGGGFIGGHLVADLREQGYSSIRVIDLKPLDSWSQFFPELDNRQLDLRSIDACMTATEGASLVFNLAAARGAGRFIEKKKTPCMLSVLINTHLLMAAKENEVAGYFYPSSSSLCQAAKQKSPQAAIPKEDDQYPPLPEDSYGWEKLFGERMCRHFGEDFGIRTRVGRYHNPYGPQGAWAGGRETTPAAVCRKVAQAKLSGWHEIEICGSGEQTQSFTFVGDCVRGTQAIMQSEVSEPVNLASDELVTIDGLVDIVEDIAQVKLKRSYDRSSPRGVTGLLSNSPQIKGLLGWAPSTRLCDGLEQTYSWIYDQVSNGKSSLVA